MMSLSGGTSRLDTLRCASATAHSVNTPTRVGLGESRLVV